MTNAALRGKTDAEDPHVWFDERGVASAATPRSGSLFATGIVMSMAFLATCVASGNTLESADSLVFCNVDRTLFWSTATNNVFAVQTARTAKYAPESVDVSGPNGMSAHYEVAGNETVVVAPRPDDPESEGLYSLQEDDGVPVSLAVVKGAVSGNSAEIVCRSGRSQWRTLRNKTVLLPIPYGTTELLIDGAIVDTGLGGAAGWYAWTPTGDGPWTLSLTVDGTIYQASVERKVGGFVLIFK